jgi:hypothetical protein
MACPRVAAEAPLLASALLALLATAAGPALAAAAPLPTSRKVAARPALAEIVALRVEVEASRLLDSQLCLQAFVWFHTGAWPVTDVRCWR